MYLLTFFKQSCVSECDLLVTSKYVVVISIWKSTCLTACTVRSPQFARLDDLSLVKEQEEGASQIGNKQDPSNFSAACSHALLSKDAEIVRFRLSQCGRRCSYVFTNYGQGGRSEPNVIFDRTTGLFKNYRQRCQSCKNMCDKVDSRLFGQGPAKTGSFEALPNKSQILPANAYRWSHKYLTGRIEYNTTQAHDTMSIQYNTYRIQPIQQNIIQHTAASVYSCLYP